MLIKRQGKKKKQKINENAMTLSESKQNDIRMTHTDQIYLYIITDLLHLFDPHLCNNEDCHASQE